MGWMMPMALMLSASSWGFVIKLPGVADWDSPQSGRGISLMVLLPWVRTPLGRDEGIESRVLRRYLVPLLYFLCTAIFYNFDLNFELSKRVQFQS